MDSSLRHDFLVGYAANALLMYVYPLPEVPRADPVGVAVAPDAGRSPAGVPNWAETFDDPAPYFETKGLSFLDAGNDLIYSAAMLYKLSGDKGALVWSKRLAAQYVKARNPETGLGAYQFTQPRQTAEPTNDSVTLSWYGDRARRHDLAWARLAPWRT